MDMILSPASLLRGTLFTEHALKLLHFLCSLRFPVRGRYSRTCRTHQLRVKWKILI